MEEYFGFDIPNEEAEKIQTVEAAINTFFRNLNSQVANKVVEQTHNDNSVQDGKKWFNSRLYFILKVYAFICFYLSICELLKFFGNYNWNASFWFLLSILFSYQYNKIYFFLISNQAYSFGNQFKLRPSVCKNLFENRNINKSNVSKSFPFDGLKAYIILLKALMITDFFTNSLQKY